jgi:hypothetical protein
MTWNVKYDSELKLVQCTVVGPNTADQINASVLETISLAKRKATNLLLLDCSKLERALSTLDVYQMPRFYVDIKINRRNKVAVILPVQQQAREDVHFYETVCRNQGWNVKAFQGRQAALDWLTDKSSR